MEHYYRIKLTPTIDNRYILLETFMVHDIIVPAGYITNGSDVPRWLWWWIPPFKPKFMPAVVVHDYLTDEKMYKEADDVFEEMLLNIEDSNYTRSMIYAVRVYHKIKYGTPMK